jgi:hypothetical protein
MNTLRQADRSTAAAARRVFFLAIFGTVSVRQ